MNAAALALRPTATAGGGGTIIPVNIYGPMEAGFTSSQVSTANHSPVFFCSWLRLLCELCVCVAGYVMSW